ncbi:MAG TPA: tyrosine-type recombinase/integrase, partial [Nevskiaceae bacterium]|nr:tyrosine-type recombinase/integrase [Nevskiaceae bacterium]
MNETDKQLTTAQKKFVTYLKNQGRATATILAYGKDTGQLVEFLNKKQITQVGSVLSEHIEAFKEYLADNNYIAKSISRKLNSIKTFFRYLEEEKLVKDNPAAVVSHPKYEVKPPRILSKMEYRALRDAARDDARMAAVIEILLQTGIRISELGRLQLDNINDKEIKIKPYESHSERTVPLNQAAKNALARYLNIRSKTRNKNVFVTKTGRPLLVRNIRAAIDRYFKIAGVEKV